MPLRGIDELQVKPGDEVCFIPHYPDSNWESKWQILTVSKVTGKAGQITTNDGKRFNQDGSEIGGSTSNSGGRSSIHKLTTELRARIAYAQNREFIKAFDYSKLTHQQASAIVAILKEPEKKGTDHDDPNRDRCQTGTTDRGVRTRATF